MRFHVFAFAALAAVLVLPEVARADDTGVVGIVTLPVLTIVGHPDRPNVTIVLTKPTAAHEAGAAHEAMRRAWVARAEPATLRATR